MIDLLVERIVEGESPKDVLMTYLYNTEEIKQLREKLFKSKKEKVDKLLVKAKKEKDTTRKEKWVDKAKRLMKSYGFQGIEIMSYVTDFFEPREDHNSNLQYQWDSKMDIQELVKQVIEGKSSKDVLIDYVEGRDISTLVEGTSQYHKFNEQAQRLVKEMGNLLAKNANKFSKMHSKDQDYHSKDIKMIVTRLASIIKLLKS